MLVTSLHGDDVGRSLDADAKALHEFVTTVNGHRLDDLALARLVRNAHRAIQTWQDGLKATRTEDDPGWHRAVLAHRRLERLARRLPTGPDGATSTWERATGEFADDLDLAPDLRCDEFDAAQALHRLVDTVQPPSTVFHEDIQHLSTLLEHLGLDHPAMNHQRVGRAHRIPETYYRQYGDELLFVAAWNNWGDVIARARDEFGFKPTMTSRAGGNAVTYAVKRGAHDALAVFAETPEIIDHAPFQHLGNVFHAIAQSDASPEETLLMARWARDHSHADPDGLDSLQQSPLLHAIKHHRLGLAELFLEWGADPNRVAPNGDSALDLLNDLEPDDPDSPASKVRVRLAERLTAHADRVVQEFNRLKMDDHQYRAQAQVQVQATSTAERFDRCRATAPATIAEQDAPVRTFAWQPPVNEPRRLPTLREVGARVEEEAQTSNAPPMAHEPPLRRVVGLRQI